MMVNLFFPFLVHSLCLESPAYILLKHRQLIRPGAACGQTV